MYVDGKLVADGTKMLTFDEKKVRADVDTRMARIEAAAIADEQKAAADLAKPPHPFAVTQLVTGNKRDLPNLLSSFQPSLDRRTLPDPHEFHLSQCGEELIEGALL